MNYIIIWSLICYQYVISIDDLILFDVEQCNSNAKYPISVSNVQLEIQNKRVFVSGKLYSENNLTSPISASLKVERYINALHIWIPVGTYEYKDLCSFGVKEKNSCPNQFQRDNIPCRCPISMGNYELKPADDDSNNVNEKLFKIISDESYHDFKAGIYSVEITVTHLNGLLTCYNVQINYTDTDYHFNNEIDNNEEKEPVISVIA